MIKQEELCKDVIKRIFMVEDLTEMKKHAIDTKNGAGNGHLPEFGLTNKRLVMQIHVRKSRWLPLILSKLSSLLVGQITSHRKEITLVSTC